MLNVIGALQFAMGSSLISERLDCSLAICSDSEQHERAVQLSQGSCGTV